MFEVILPALAAVLAVALSYLLGLAVRLFARDGRIGGGMEVRSAKGKRVTFHSFRG
jgi:hypothetical protein